MGVYLKALKLVNFQSWEDTTISLSDGLNVIIAANNTGKSVIIKALKLFASPQLYDAEDRSHLIRYGKDNSSMTFLFDDNSIIVAQFGRRSSKYIYIEDQSNPVPIDCGDRPTRLMLDKLGLILNTEGDFVVSIVDMDQNMFLVNSDNKTNSSVIEALTYNEDLQKLLDTTAERMKSLRTEKSYFTNKLNLIEHKLSSMEFVDTDSLESKIEVMEVYRNFMDYVIDIYDCVGHTFDKTINVNIEAEVAMSNFVNKLIDVGILEKNIVTQYKDSSTEIRIVDIASSLLEFVDKRLAVDYKPHNITAIDKLVELASIGTECCEDISYTSGDIEIVNIATELASIEMPEILQKPDISVIDFIDNTIPKLTELLKVSKNLHNSLADLKSNETALEVINKNMDEIGGEEFDCPVQGKVKLLNGQCLSISD